MTQRSISSGLEDKITGLLSSLAVTNEGVMSLTKIAEKHEALLYGKDENGGLVTRGNVVRQTLEDHQASLDRLEKSCADMVSFMESQVEINRQQQATTQNINRVIYGLAGLVFLILLLIGVADIQALHNLLVGSHLP